MSDKSENSKNFTKDLLNMQFGLLEDRFRENCKTRLEQNQKKRLRYWELCNQQSKG